MCTRVNRPEHTVQKKNLWNERRNGTYKHIFHYYYKMQKAQDELERTKYFNRPFIIPTTSLKEPKKKSKKTNKKKRRLIKRL